MLFEEVIGQSEVTGTLLAMVREGKVPHALLFTGMEGCGKLPAALALASYLLCSRPDSEGRPCGHCQACHQMQRWVHPDLHFIFPVYKPKSSGSQALSDHFIKEWREQLADSLYFSLSTWFNRIGLEKKQTLISVAEAEHIIGKLSLVSSQGGHRVVIIWNADQMNEATANKLLKILEEPPQGVVFILTTSHPERMLATILSRTQRIDFPPIAEEALTEALVARNGLGHDVARQLAHIATGSYTKALEQVRGDEDQVVFFDLFALLMRLCYARKVKELYAWAEQVAQWGREKQKAFLDYAQHMVRENFIYNFGQRQLNYQTAREADFSVRFARFVNEQNVISLTDELAAAQRDIEQNVNARMVFFDLALKLIMLLLKGSR